MSVPAIIKKELDGIGVPYEFMRWTSAIVPEQYWVGEYSETPTDAEDGSEETTMMLTGTTKGFWSILESTKEKIKSHFPNPYGLRIPTDDGAVAIFYDNSFPVKTGEAVLKRMQINLRIKKWRGLN